MSLILNHFSNNAGLSDAIFDYLTAQDIARFHASSRGTKKSYDDNHAGEQGAKLRQVTDAYLKAEKAHKARQENEIKAISANITTLQSNFDRETESTWLGRLVYRITFHNDFLACIGKIFFLFCCVRQKAKRQITLRNQITAARQRILDVQGTTTFEKQNYDALIQKTKTWAPIVSLFSRTWKKLEENSSDMGPKTLNGFESLWSLNSVSDHLRNNSAKCFMRGTWGERDYLAIRAIRGASIRVEVIANGGKDSIIWKAYGDQVLYDWAPYVVQAKDDKENHRTAVIVDRKIAVLSRRVRNYIHRQSQIEARTTKTEADQKSKAKPFELPAIPEFLLESPDKIVKNLFGGPEFFQHIQMIKSSFKEITSKTVTRQSVLSSSENVEYYLYRSFRSDYLYITEMSVKEKKETLIYVTKTWPTDKKDLFTIDAADDFYGRKDLIESCTHPVSNECVERLEIFAAKLHKHLEQSTKSIQDSIPKECIAALFTNPAPT